MSDLINTLNRMPLVRINTGGWVTEGADPAAELLTAALAMRLTISKNTTDAVNTFGKTADKYEKLVNSYQPYEITEAELLGKDSKAVLADISARQIAYPRAQEIEAERIQEAARKLRTAIYDQAQNWMGELNTIYIKEHDDLYLTSDDDFDSKREIQARIDRRNTIASMHRMLCEYLYGKFPSSSNELQFALYNYEFTTALFKEFAERTGPDYSGGYNRAFITAIGCKPRLYNGGNIDDEYARIAPPINNFTGQFDWSGA